MTGYNLVNIAEVLKIKDDIKNSDSKKEKQKAERAVERILKFISAFSCPQNLDVEDFLKQKALTFAEQGIAATYLIFTSYKDEVVLVGYFTLANKYLFVSDRVAGSKSLKRRISRFGEHNKDLKGYQMSIPLIAQLGKNFTNNYNQLITGDELLKMACDKIIQIQTMISGKMTYVECEDKNCLIGFYTSNGFMRIGERQLTNTEKTINEPDYLIQLIKYLKR